MAEDFNGDLKWLRAIYNNDIATTKKLIIDGIDTEGTNFINATNFIGTTGLIIASGYGHTEMVKLLLKFGADIDVKDENGWTAIAEAIWRGRIGIIKLLLEHKHRGNSIEMIKSIEKHLSESKRYYPRKYPLTFTEAELTELTLLNKKNPCEHAKEANLRLQLIKEYS